MRSSGESLRVDVPVTYEVRVEGWVSTRWTDYLEGMTITLDGGDDSPAVSVLCGELADQSALLGLLHGLHNLGFPLLEVRALRPA